MNFTKSYRYMKGVYEASFFGLDRSLMYHSNKLTENNIASSVNMGELNAGVGNPVVIQLPDTAKFAVTLTSQDIDLSSRQLQTGGELAYNGVTSFCEIITPSTTALTVTETPVAPYGSDEVVCYINGDSTKYIVSASTKIVAGFTATPGTAYAVQYYIAKAASQVLDIKAMFAPVIGTMEITMPVYAAPTSDTTYAGTLCGKWHVIIPRFQFGGEAGVQSNQTTAATSSLTGQAIAYDPTTNQCGNGESTLIYMVYEPIDPTEGITDMVVIDGGAVSVAEGDTVVIPVRFVMADGRLAVPDLTELDYVSATPGTASVEDGVVTGVAAGDTEITITLDDPALTAYCNVEVTS